MKKQFFLFAIMLLSIVTTAQQRTFTKSVSVNYATKQVTFHISWATGSRGVSGASTYNSKVWVLVDYQEIQNGNPYGDWKRADIDLNNLPINCTADGTNTKGFWYQGQETAAQNATITVTLKNVPSQFKWCTFASDCPPNVYIENDTYTLRGTSPFILRDKNGNTQTVSSKSIAFTGLSIVPISISDATGCSSSIGFCPYAGSDWFQDATHICQHRSGGDKNWEAWIKDVRDSKLYRIVYMPDNHWWFAQSMNYQAVTYCCYNNVASNCNDEYGALYPHSAANAIGFCPSGWELPSHQEFAGMLDAVNGGGTLFSDCVKRGDGYCSTNTPVSNWLKSFIFDNGSDRYGFSIVGVGASENGASGYFGRGERCDFWTKGFYRWSVYNNTSIYQAYDGRSYRYPVRCVKD